MSEDKGVWEEWDGGHNVGARERVVSLALGVLLASLGLARRNKSGFLMALLGAFLLHRGVTQQCAIYRALGFNTLRDDEDTFEIL